MTPSSTALLASSFVCALVVAHGCSSDHSRLEKEPTTAAAGGAGGMGGAASSSASSGTGGTGGIEEPPGPTKLTVVNGIVDHDAVRLCFTPYPDGGGMPWPGSDGLGYAASAVVDPIASVVPESADVELVVMAGDLPATAGASCDELVTSPPAGVEVLSLGVLPASVFTEEKSLLIVPNGCVGGPGHTDEQLEEAVCGPGYADGLPNASLLAGFMSRLGAPSKLPLQFAQASQGGGALALQVRPGIDGAAAQLVVADWTLGAVAPFPPFEGFATENLGQLEQVALEVHSADGVMELATVSWSTALSHGNLTASDVANGKNLTFVAVGPMPGIAAQSWWNGFTFVAVASDPD